MHINSTVIPLVKRFVTTSFKVRHRLDRPLKKQKNNPVLFMLSNILFFGRQDLVTILVTDALTVAFLLSAGVAGVAPPSNSAAENPGSVLNPRLFRGRTHSVKMVNKCRVTENKLYEQSGSLKIHSRWLKGCVSSFAVSTVATVTPQSYL